MSGVHILFLEWGFENENSRRRIPSIKQQRSPESNPLSEKGAETVLRVRGAKDEFGNYVAEPSVILEKDAESFGLVAKKPKKQRRKPQPKADAKVETEKKEEEVKKEEGKTESPS